MTLRKTKPVLLEDKPTGGRGRVKIDKVVLRALASVHCNLEEICAGLIAAGCQLAVRTLKRRLQETEFRDIWEQGKAERRIALRRLQWRHAQSAGSSGVQMTIHLSKHWLGETEKAALEVSGRVDSTVEVNTSARDRVNAKLDAVAKRQSSRIDGLAAAVGAKRAAKEPVGS